MPPRRGRVKLISVDGWKELGPWAELEPESTISTDQLISEIALRSADSYTNKSVLRGHAQAADDLEHILAGVSLTFTPDVQTLRYPEFVPTKGAVKVI